MGRAERSQPNACFSDQFAKKVRFGRRYTTLFTTFTTLGDIVRRWKQFLRRRGRDGLYLPLHYGFCAAKEVNAIKALRGRVHSDFLYFQRADYESMRDCGDSNRLRLQSQYICVFLHYILVD